MAAKGKYIRCGTSVILRLPPDHFAVTEGLRAFDGFVLKVSRIVRVRETNSSSSTTSYMELEDCVSDKGVPYGIAADWVKRADVQGYGGFRP